MSSCTLELHTIATCDILISNASTFKNSKTYFIYINYNFSKNLNSYVFAKVKICWYHHCVISNIEEATTNKNLILNDMISQHHKMIWSKWEQEDLQKVFKSFGSLPLKMREFFPYMFLCCTSHHCNSNHLCIIELWWFFQIWRFKILKAIHQTFFWGYTINVSLAWTL
jgi:hypothetical protein